MDTFLTTNPKSLVFLVFFKKYKKILAFVRQSWLYRIKNYIIFFVNKSVNNL
jgi:hypothetical protein